MHIDIMCPYLDKFVLFFSLCYVLSYLSRLCFFQLFIMSTGIGE